MWEPRQQIEGSRTDRFRPPHCPWPECPDHTAESCAYRCTSKGSYRRRRDPWHLNRRFKCSRCSRTFGQNAFSVTYYLKRPDLLPGIANLLVSGCGHRQIARHFVCAPSTVTRQSERLGRHMELFHQASLAKLDAISEPVVLDHFETFVRSQQERLGIATAVGQVSWFVYALRGASYLRLKGRSQRKRALKVSPKRPARGEVLRSTRETLELLLRKSRGHLNLISDDHPVYRSAVACIPHSSSPKIRHTIHANPDRSPGHDRAIARGRDRAMFAVDLLHKLWRHSQAHHSRETLAFGRKRASVLGRGALFAVWRNMIKLVSERRPTTLTPAMRLGLTSKPWTWADVLAERLFERRATPAQA